MLCKIKENLNCVRNYRNGTFLFCSIHILAFLLSYVWLCVCLFVFIFCFCFPFLYFLFLICILLRISS